MNWSHSNQHKDEIYEAVKYNNKIENGINYEESIRTLDAVAALLIWAKFLYFFRIFRSTGYYIRMVLEVYKDIRSFLFIFFTIVLAFS